MRNSGRKFFKKYNLEQFTVCLKVYIKNLRFSQHYFLAHYVSLRL